MSEARARKPVDLWDLGGVMGVASIGTGLWWVHPPSALVTVGALMLVGCLLGSRRAARATEG